MNLIRKISALCASIKHHSSHSKNALRRGVAAVEFALTLPIWVTILLGTGDGTYFLVSNEKTDRIAYTTTDIVSQYQTINKASLADIVQAAAQIMSPITFGSNGIIIITSVYQASGDVPRICWQYTGGGTLAAQTSKVGTAGAACAKNVGALATVPNKLVLNDGDNIIISEVYYNFKPLFLSDSMFPSTKLYRVAVYKPRLSPLTIPPT